MKTLVNRRSVTPTFSKESIVVQRESQLLFLDTANLGEWSVVYSHLINMCMHIWIELASKGVYGLINILVII